MSNDSLAGFCQLASQQKNLALVFLIEKVLKHQKIHVFGELLSVKSVIALKTAGEEPGNEQNSDSFKRSYNTLELFAYGTYGDYLRDSSLYIELSEDMSRKLKQLSIISMAMENKILTYNELQEKLMVNSVRELEDLIIDTIYNGLITAKMNQKEQILRVQSFVGRDVRLKELPRLIEQLTVFQRTCEEQISVTRGVTEVMKEAREYNAEEQEALNRKFGVVKEKVKKSIKDANATPSKIEGVANN